MYHTAPVVRYEYLYITYQVCIRYLVQYGTMIVIRRYAYNYIIIIIPGIYIYGRNFAASAQRVLRCRCAASRASIAGRNRHLVSSSACVTFQLRHVRQA